MGERRRTFGASGYLGSRLGLAAGAVLLATAVASGQTRPTTRPAATGPATTRAAAPVDVAEWSVFVYDTLAEKLNPDGVVTGALPPFVGDRRTAAEGPVAATAISPVGVIRFGGRPTEKVDVTLGHVDGGSFLASWPKAQERASGLLWRSLTLQDGAGDGVVKVDPGSRFDVLRAGAKTWAVDAKGGGEPFLLYDVTLPYTCPVAVVGPPPSPAGVRVANTGAAPIHRLTLFRQQGGAWATAAVGDLRPAPATRPTSGPSTTQATTRATSQATTQATTRPAPQVTALAAVPGATPESLATAFAAAALPAGATAGDRATVAALLVRHGFDGPRLTAAYVLDESEMDRLLPLEVLPQPRHLSRVGIVILRNIDPAAGTDVDDLVGQLGDPAWPKREAASKSLAAFGPAAAEKLRAAVKNPDPEVSWRAERLLSLLNAAKPGG